MVYNGPRDGEFWAADIYKLWTNQRTVITLVCAIYFKFKKNWIALGIRAVTDEFVLGFHFKFLKYPWFTFKQNCTVIKSWYYMENVLITLAS